VNDVIHLSGLEVFAHHGVFDHEKETGQRFVIDADIEWDGSPAAVSDNLADTLDYQAVAVAIRDAVASDPVDLLEALALRVLKVIFAFEKAEAVTLTIHKPDVEMPVDIAGVAITVHRQRSEVV
jgi:dihydroneopterin aldolase